MIEECCQKGGNPMVVPPPQNYSLGTKITASAVTAASLAL